MSDDISAVAALLLAAREKFETAINEFNVAKESCGTAAAQIALAVGSEDIATLNTAMASADNAERACDDSVAELHSAIGLVDEYLRRLQG